MTTAVDFQHPDITPEMLTQIDTFIDDHKDSAGAVIPVLRMCQDVVGYLPLELIDYISQGLGLPASEVLGVATFYALFSITPKGRHTIKTCLGTACYVKGIKEVMDRIGSEYNISEGQTTEDRRFTLQAVRCLGACGLAPVVVIDGDTHGIITADKVLKILEKYE